MKSIKTFVASIVLCNAIFTISLTAQTKYCAEKEATTNQSDVTIPTSGKFKALIVFVRFKDDTASGG